MNIKLIPTVFTAVNGSKVPAKIEDPNSLYGFRLMDGSATEEVEVSKQDFLRLLQTGKLDAIKEIMTLFHSAQSKAMFERAVFERGCLEFGGDVVDLASLTEEETGED